MKWHAFGYFDPEDISARLCCICLSNKSIENTGKQHVFSVYECVLVVVVSYQWYKNICAHAEWYFFSRDIGLVTPKIIDFPYLKNYFLDQSTPKKIHIWFWKSEHWTAYWYFQGPVCTVKVLTMHAACTLSAAVRMCEGCSILMTAVTTSLWGAPCPQLWVSIARMTQPAASGKQPLQAVEAFGMNSRAWIMLLWVGRSWDCSPKIPDSAHSCQHDSAWTSPQWSNALAGVLSSYNQWSVFQQKHRFEHPKK